MECGGSGAPSGHTRPVCARASSDNIETEIKFSSEPESDDDCDEEEVVAPVTPWDFHILMETLEDADEPSPPQSMLLLLSAAAPSSPASTPVKPKKFLDFKWRSFLNPYVPTKMKEVFSDSKVGPAVPLAVPYKIFVHMWDRPLMKHLALETNKYVQQLVAQSVHPSSRICDWKDMSADELYVNSAFNAVMGIVGKGRLVDYWSANTSIFMTPDSVYMSLRRFELLSKCLHIRENKDMYMPNLDRSEAKLFKIVPIVNHLNSVFQLSYNLQQDIDKSLLQRRGCMDINQFIPNKAAAVGIKTRNLCTVNRLLVAVCGSCSQAYRDCGVWIIYYRHSTVWCVKSGST